VICRRRTRHRDWHHPGLERAVGETWRRSSSPAPPSACRTGPLAHGRDHGAPYHIYVISTQVAGILRHQYGTVLCCWLFTGRTDRFAHPFARPRRRQW
jgi:hypothetical protein